MIPAAQMLKWAIYYLQSEIWIKKDRKQMFEGSKEPETRFSWLGIRPNMVHAVLGCPNGIWLGLKALV